MKIDFPLYLITEQEDADLITCLDKMLLMGFISNKFSTFSSLVVFTAKINGFMFPCVDCEHLNNLNVPDPNLLPLEATIAHSIANLWIFSKLDLVSAFDQVRVTEDQKEMTAIRTRMVCFHFRVTL